MTDLPAPQPYPNPEDAITDAERQVIVRQIQTAMSRDEIRFEEIDDRFADVYKATNRAELDAVIADLPTPPAPIPPPPGHPLPRQSATFLGDLKVGGWIDVQSDLNYGTVLGDVVIDLSSATLPDGLTITVWTGAGDTTIILPDGVRAGLEGFMAFGSRKVELVDPVHGAPLVTVKVFKLIGDTKLYSLSRVPEGRFRKLWRKLRQTSQAND